MVSVVLLLKKREERKGEGNQGREPVVDLFRKIACLQGREKDRGREKERKKEEQKFPQQTNAKHIAELSSLLFSVIC